MYRRHPLFAVSLLLSLAFTMSLPAQQPAISTVPPVAQKHPKSLTLHGDTRVDDYGWFRNRQDPAVIAHLNAENAYTEAMTASTQPLRDALYAELVGRIKEQPAYSQGHPAHLPAEFAGIRLPGGEEQFIMDFQFPANQSAERRILGPFYF